MAPYLLRTIKVAAAHSAACIGIGVLPVCTVLAKVIIHCIMLVYIHKLCSSRRVLSRSQGGTLYRGTCLPNFGRISHNGWRDSSIINPFGPLPALGPCQEDEHSDKDNCPLPGDADMHKDDSIKDRDVQGRKDEEEDNGDGEKEELIAPQVHAPPLRTFWHGKERPPEVNEFPSKKQEHPGHGGVRSGAGLENRLALV